MKCPAVIEIAQMVKTKQDVPLHGVLCSIWKEKRQSMKVKLSFKNVTLIISCMCTNRCGVGEMRRRKMEKRRVGREEGILR